MDILIISDLMKSKSKKIEKTKVAKDGAGTVEEGLFVSGHSACAGCGPAILMRQIVNTLGQDIIVVNATGCMEIVSSKYPESAWNVPYIHSLFENGPAVASGVARNLRANGNSHTRVVYIGGDGACYTPDTKVLTSEGFKWISEIKVGDLIWSVKPDTQELELQPVTKLHNYFYEGNAIRAKTRYIDFLVTPDHSIPIISRKSKKMSTIKARDLLKRYKTLLLRSFKWQGKKVNKFVLPVVEKRTSQKEFKEFNMRDWIQFIGWYVTEGCCYHSNSGYLIRIYQSNKENRKKILELMKRMSLPAFECNRSVDVQSKQLFMYLKNNCGDYFYNKRLPREYLDLNQEYLNLLFNTLIAGDGSRQSPRKGRRMDKICFVSKSPYLISNFVEICLKLGSNCNIAHQKDGTVIVGVQRKHVKNELYSTRTFGKDKPQVFEEYYSGPVYCPELPKNHTIVIERNGKVSLNGNSYDIGFGALSGALERNEDVIFIIYDTECYSNTGVQRSSATPKFANTTTSPVGSKLHGKQEARKHIGLIAAAHNIAYVATASVGNLPDLKRKLQKAKETRGASVIIIYASCTFGWKFDTNLTIKMARLALQSGMWKLYEFDHGKLIMGQEPTFESLEEYFKLQRRYKHIQPAEIEIIKKDIKADWEFLKAMVRD